MSDETIEADQIAASNVRPAYEASLRHGVSEAQLERACGLTRAALATDEASISAAETYRHMEMMFARPGFESFVIEAVEIYGASSLGVVGLACKTAATVGDAMRCHQRFQHLTNRSARYESALIEGRVVVSEQRSGAARLGSLLMSDYTMLVAVHLLRGVCASSLTPLGMASRRETMPESERRCYEAFLGAPVACGSSRASVSFAPELLTRPLHAADPELQHYFQALLGRATHFEADEAPLLRTLRVQLRDALVHGTPTSATIAARMGLGQRTLQRRLASLGHSFNDVLESTRQRLAEGYLADPELSLAEVAYLLGYAEQSSLFRAFMRWHGTTPGAYRRGIHLPQR